MDREKKTQIKRANNSTLLFALFLLDCLLFFCICCVQGAISESVYEVEVFEEIGEEAGIEMNGGIL